MAKSRKNIRKTNRGHYKKSFIPYPFTKNEELLLKVDSLSNLGHGVARIDHTPEQGEPVKDWVVFIPFALPGESVKVKVTHNAKKNSIAEIVEVVTPSEHRIEPTCKHFFYCGGCQYQHLNYTKQMEYQTEQISEMLQRMACVEHPVNSAISSPKIWNYRSKITPHYKKPERGKIGAIGFHHHSDKNQIIDIHSCAIAMDEINQALPAIKKRVQGNARTYHSDGQLLLRTNNGNVETSETSIIEEKVGDISFYFLAGDFFQNNPFILEAFTNYVAKEAARPHLKYLVDAYCGCGLFSLCLAKHFEQVAGVEVSKTSTDWARHNAKLNEIENAIFLDESAEHIFDHIEFNAHETAMVIDPPRAGCNQDFLDQLFRFKPNRIVYVSCDPATQMRDLKSFLAENYQIEAIQPFDLFPHTRHLECVITLQLKS